MWNHFSTIAVVASLLVPSVAQASRDPFKGSGTLEQVVKKITQQQQGVKTLQADFRQEKELALLSKPDVSTGTFVFAKPNNVLWVYQQPKPVTMLISGGWLTTYYPSLRKAERMQVSRYEDRIFRYIGASTGALKDMSKYFDFTFTDRKGDREYKLVLKPKSKMVASRVRGITIWIDRQTYFTTRFEYIEADGDLTRYEFANIRINQPVPQSRFTVNLPAGVKVEQMKMD